jgi:hypothetical protein
VHSPAAAVLCLTNVHLQAYLSVVAAVWIESYVAPHLTLIASGGARGWLHGTFVGTQLCALSGMVAVHRLQGHVAYGCFGFKGADPPMHTTCVIITCSCTPPTATAAVLKSTHNLLLHIACCCCTMMLWACRAY